MYAVATSTINNKASHRPHNIKKPTKWILTGLGIATALCGCTTARFTQTSTPVEISKFMGKWYVITGRTTYLEQGAHNAVEIYTWNKDKERIDIDFTYRKDSFEGKQKSLPQKAWIVDSVTNAHWKVQPFWPLKFDYLILAVDAEYTWTAIGVPGGKYLWIMARTPTLAPEKMDEILRQLNAIHYPVDKLVPVPQRW